MRVEGRNDFVIKEKFNILKGSLRKWNLEFFGKVNLEVEENKPEINTLNILLVSCKEDQV